VAERVDIIVDFSKIKSNRVYFVNRAEQVNGRGPTGKTLSPGQPVLQVNLTGPVLPSGTDDSADPSVGAVGNVGMKLRDLPDMDFAALNARAAKATQRTWRFERGAGGWMVNGKFFDRTSSTHRSRWARKRSGPSRTRAARGVTRCTSTTKSTAC